MRIFHRSNRGGKRLPRKPKSKNKLGVRFAALLVCLAMLAGLLPAWVTAADSNQLAGIVTFQRVSLHYADADGKAGEPVEDKALLKKSDNLVLLYQYEITEAQCAQIQAGVAYDLEVSPRLVLPNLEDGAPLIADGETEPFGMIYSNGTNAWVKFFLKEDGSGTILSEYGGLQGAEFHLSCKRPSDVPGDATEEERRNNLYTLKFETGELLTFGYAEHEPVKAKAAIKKGGSLTDRTVTWTIDYTPWQNPDGENDITLGTPFELQDTIEPGLHSYVEGSVTIGGQRVHDYASRDEVQGNEDVYVIAETPVEGGATTLTFGGTRFNAGTATQSDTLVPLKITYQTAINDDLLLPGDTGGKTVTNAAQLFADTGKGFNRLEISSAADVSIPQLTWLTKEGATDRHTDGTGSTTAWTVKFLPNGFRFTADNHLTLHDRLPAGSELVENSVKVNGQPVASIVEDTDHSFTVSDILAADGQQVEITYQTHVPEEMYDKGTNLGKNVAQFTFQYNGLDYSTPKATAPVGSGDGSGTPGTDPLVKSSGTYNQANRTIEWTVKINPHKANLKGGTFTDDLSTVGHPCTQGHTGGLQLEGGIHVSMDGASSDSSLVTTSYENQQITIEVGNVGATAITLTYKTKVCDPCIFANNTAPVKFTNTVSTDNIQIGSQPPHRISAESTAEAGTTVLTKKPPVYNYKTGCMQWTVEVNGAGLPMKDVVLTDELPAGLEFVPDSFSVSPAASESNAEMQGQRLTIRLGALSQKTAVKFDTRVDPEALGFDGGETVVVGNTIRMQGSADDVVFAEVSHSVKQNFSNHGLVKSDSVDNQQEFIQYEVLINPYHLELPEEPSLVDTLDSRLQLDPDTLRFYEADLTGTSGDGGSQKPVYTKKGDGQPVKISSFDPDTNCFTVPLPVSADRRGAYVLTYTADIINHQAGGYSNSVRFSGGSIVLGGSKENSAAVGGGGGGGGGGVAARKATIAITKIDSETKDPLPGVSFTLYQWDSGANARGLALA